MSELVKIRVHYPLEGGSLVLRTDADWERDLEPTAEGSARTRFDFEVRLDRPYLYFKPVLLRGGATIWARGENCLALANGKAVREVYPYFFSDDKCSACELTELRSETGGRSHAVRVFYPPGYEENALACYPVLYMQDGQNLFFPEESFSGHHWRVEETLRILDAMNLVRKAIVVGIYPVDRSVDYTLPGYASYGQFVVEVVKPWLESTYRALTGPRHTAVMGSSLGGVVSFYLAWQWPQVFGHTACLSSTFGWRDDLRERVAGEERRPIRLYLDSGWPGDNYEVTRGMRNLLLARGYREGRDLLYLAFPRAPHNEEAWAMRAHIPFQHFFRG